MLAEQLVGEARARRAREMHPRERAVEGVFAALFIVVALVIAALLPSQRDFDPILLVGLIVGYAVIDRVRFEFGSFYGTAEQLLLVPILLLLPLPYVLLLVGAAGVAGTVPDIVAGRWHRERLASRLADSWYCVPPVLVLAAFAPGEPNLGQAGIYALAFASQLGGDFAYTVIRDRLFDRQPLRELAAGWIGIARVDTIFTPIAFFITLTAANEPITLLAIGPFAWLLKSFSKDREDRYAQALELHRAYRGTVMLLSDVIEFEDDYTAEHSRSVVGLVNAVAHELGFEDQAHQELEFAAMLHDVGKISISKEILNKPSALTDEEFEVMKTHTIEGQFMLDRVGGLLARVGEIVRSCHERWDGAGYPDGLKGAEIPLASRIVFACDAYHAMTSDRVYRAAMPREDALEELLVNSGTQFDPNVIVALTQVIHHGEPVVAAADEVRAILARVSAPPSVGTGVAG
jgi:HD-GYP domain-containing protein (c-di-GMP phosphodiesterase class II)